MIDSKRTILEEMDGFETIHQLVAAIYGKVEVDEILRSVFPEGLEAGKV